MRCFFAPSSRTFWRNLRAEKDGDNRKTLKGKKDIWFWDTPFFNSQKKISAHRFSIFVHFQGMKFKIGNSKWYYFCTNTLPKDLHKLIRLIYWLINSHLQSLYSQHLNCELTNCKNKIMVGYIFTFIQKNLVAILLRFFY